MNARRVAAAAGVIHAAQKNRQTAAGIAASLEAAQLLQSPESAAEQLALLAEVDQLRVRVEQLVAQRDDLLAESFAAELADDPDDSPLHRTYTDCRDLPTGGAL